MTDANITLTGSGGSRALTLKPVGVGLATITVTATTPDGVSGHAQFQYGSSAAAPDATSAYLYGAADASTAIDVGDGYFIVADDENSTLRLYNGAHSGFPVKSWNFDAQIATPGELDLEWSARHGNTIVWGGSESNSKTGDARPSASTVFATTVSGAGEGTGLSFAGHYNGLRGDLLAWDASSGGQFGFAAAAAEGVQPKQAGGYNIEGVDFGPSGSNTAYLGFRAPIAPPAAREEALVVPVTNLLDLLSGAASHATFGAPLQWNLGGRGVREIRGNADGQYLVIAGEAGEGGSQHLYTWDGNPAHQPLATETTLPNPSAIEGAWESVVSVPDPLVNGAAVQLIEDNGDTVWYGGSTIGKDLPSGLEKDWTDSFTLAGVTELDEIAPNPPSTSADRAPDFAGGGGWYKDSVAVSFTDNGDPPLAGGIPGSGVDPASIPAPVTLTTDGSHTASGTVGDKAGNQSAPGSLTVQVDASAPSLQVDCPASAVVGEKGVVATVTASDGQSGLASDPGGTVAIDTSTAGSRTVTRTAVDNVGHSTTQSCTTAVAHAQVITGAVKGTLTIKASQDVELTSTAKVSGPTKVKAGGSLDIEGATLAGPLTSNGATSLRICGARLSGTVKLSNGSGPVVLGDGSDECAANSFYGNATVKGNTAGVMVEGEALVDENVFHGALKVMSNSGGTTVANNEAHSSLTVKGNAAPVIDTPNVVEGKSKVQ